MSSYEEYKRLVASDEKRLKHEMGILSSIYVFGVLLLMKAGGIL